MLTLTFHAMTRMRDRGISAAAIKNAFMYGIEKIADKGVRVYKLSRDLAENLFEREGLDIVDESGLEIVVSPDNTVITAYRI